MKVGVLSFWWFLVCVTAAPNLDERGGDMKELSDGCVKFVEESVDDLIVRLATDLEPEALCTVSGPTFLHYLITSLLQFRKHWM
ncbi:hypothetical protein P879_06615 [Paragonimus westermani]|uniref:Saposin B-type domain-containing protein n=1 Tax=Paragonimus westermani TaxID=34504 RepID=A0A8T0DAJ3_9TREM|nr:hypothetical protein P879_06615 [Paragonimus westermani]